MQCTCLAHLALHRTGSCCSNAVSHPCWPRRTSAQFNSAESRLPRRLQAASGKPAASAAVAGAEDLVEKEARRLEVMRRRQERELAQLIAYEMVRKEMQERAEAKVGWAGLADWHGGTGEGPGWRRGLRRWAGLWVTAWIQRTRKSAFWLAGVAGL